MATMEDFFTCKVTDEIWWKPQQREVAMLASDSKEQKKKVFLGVCPIKKLLRHFLDCLI